MSDDKRIITSNLDSEFNKARLTGIQHNKGNGGMMRTALIEKNALPPRIQRKMANASGVNMKMGNPTFYHPLFQSTNMYIPRDRRERNEWCRHFYRTEPIIRSAIDLHTEFPISDFQNVCSDPYVKKFFDYMAFEKLSMVSLLLKIGLEYWKLGDVFPFGQLNETEGIWEKFTVLNPDYIDIKTSVMADEPMIELIPDSQIQAIVQAGPKGEWGEIYQQLPDDVIRQVKMGKNIRLDNRLVSHISHKAAEYESWGTPIMMCCFKTLIYKDKLRQAQDAIANRHIMPLRVAKLGTPGEAPVSQDDIDSFRDTLLAADDDPNYFIVYHYGLQFDYVGSSGKILPLNQEFDFIQKELMNGLMINQAMLNGEGPTYANAQVGMDTLARRYMSYRLVLEEWIRRKVYKPIAEIQGFYQPVNGEISAKYMSPRQKKISAARKDMQLIVPEIAWQHMDLTSNSSVLTFIQNLQQKGLVSMTTVLPLIQLDPETEKRNLEAERGTVFDPNAPKTGPLPSEGGALGTTPGTPGGGGNSKPTAPPTRGDEGGSPSNVPTPPPGGKGGAPTPPQAPAKPNAPGVPQQNAPQKGRPNPKDFGFPKHTSLQDFFTKNGEAEASTPHRSPKVKIRRKIEN